MSKRIEKDWFFNAALGTHIEISKKKTEKINRMVSLCLHTNINVVKW